METIQKTNDLHGLASTLSESYNIANPQAVTSEANLSAFENLPFPSRKDEYWKYTRTARISKTNWAFETRVNSADYSDILKDFALRMVFVNGAFQPKLSTNQEIAGVSILAQANGNSSKEILEDPNPFLALNHAMPQAGYAMVVDKDTSVEDILHIIHIYDGTAVIAQPSNSIIVNAGSKIVLNELHFHLDNGATFSNIATKIKVGSNCNVGIDIIQQGNSHSNHLQQVDVELPSDSEFTQNTYSLSGGWIRNNTNVRITGSNATANLNGFYIPWEKEHIDNHTIVDHLEPHCLSNELYRGVLLGSSTGVFNGKVFVRPDAQKTNAFQSNGNILMSDNATINSKPELEIYADDVKCSHGSTTGQFDEEALFYLMARGISRNSAKKMLVSAFAEDVLEQLANPALRTLIESEIHRKLAD